MTLKTRRFIYLSFILVFLLAAPPLVLYTAGFRYNLKKHALEQTGVIVLNAEPRDAVVTVNGARAQGEMPIRVKRVNPNLYTLRAEKEGYHAWEKTLSVETGRTTFAYDIVLFKKNLPELLNVQDADTARSGDDQQFPDKTITVKPAQDQRAFTLTLSHIGRPLRTRTLTLPSGAWRAVAGPTAFAALLNDATHDAYVVDLNSDPAKILLHIPATAAEWQKIKEGHRVLLSNDIEATVFDPARGEVQVLGRWSEGLKAAAWVPKTAWVFLVIGDEARVAELDDRDRRNVFSLFTATQIADISFDEKGETLYFTGTVGAQSGRWKVRLR